jgi:hypothetical protein
MSKTSANASGARHHGGAHDRSGDGDALLLRWGQAAAVLSDQREVFRLQAEAAREEWRRRRSARRGIGGTENRGL